MTDSSRSDISNKTHSDETKACPSELAHLAVLRLANAGLIPKVLELVAHLGIELVDHFLEKDVSSDNCEVSSDVDTEVADWALGDE